MTPAQRPPHARWPPLVASLAICGLYYGLPEHLTVGPGWLLAVVTASLLVPTTIFHRKGRRELNQIFAYAVLVTITLGMISSLTLLVMRLPQHKDPPVDLLRAASALWISNVLLFASWYWRLDGGGPNARDRRSAHLDGAFLFPQMVMDPELKKRMGEEYWSPGFVDYVFLAFNTSTAFSPTDVPVLTRWAKVLMMVQSMISLTTVALLAARAVNIL
ncbi:MAG: hypothetical protein ABUS49_07010 [Acidobacteriota bacterium]